MQGFDYDDIKNKYGDKAQMLLTDTDSLLYKIKAENIYEDFYKDKELFDISNYNDKHIKLMIRIIKGWSKSSKRYRRTKLIFAFLPQPQRRKTETKKTPPYYRKINRINVEFILS